jgi:uncharacterized protein (TIGR01244 family)
MPARLWSRLTGALAGLRKTGRTGMEIRELTQGYAVSPQIEPSDLPALAAAGFTTIICNRPDAENPAERGSDAMRAAAEREGLAFVHNPLSHGSLTQDIVDLQRSTIDAADGPVFAYCASGNRCSILWALAEAGRVPTDDLIAAAARWGYQLEGLRPQIDSLAKG